MGGGRTPRSRRRGEGDGGTQSSMNHAGPKERERRMEREKLEVRDLHEDLYHPSPSRPTALYVFSQIFINADLVNFANTHMN